MSESNYTKSTNPVHKYDEQTTHYDWYEDDKNSNCLVLSNQVSKFINFL